MAAKPKPNDTHRWTLLDTYSSMKGKSIGLPGKLIVILFNDTYTSRWSIEYKIDKWKQRYTDDHGVQFYKCCDYRADRAIEQHLGVEYTPTIVFLRDGEVVGRIDDLDEAYGRSSAVSDSSGATNDEAKVKRAISDLVGQTDAKKEKFALSD